VEKMKKQLFRKRHQSHTVQVMNMENVLAIEDSLTREEAKIRQEIDICPSCLHTKTGNGVCFFHADMLFRHVEIPRVSLAESFLRSSIEEYRNG